MVKILLVKPRRVDQKRLITLPRARDTRAILGCEGIENGCWAFGGLLFVTDFRGDIQGLRALSILAVIFYHAQVPGFSAGFVGVDVFFVISGFLITGLLARELDSAGRLDLLRFWARRAARLLPNALLVLFGTFAATLYLLPALEREAAAKDIAAALIYGANYRFAARSLDYFDASVAASPVLHFWSLGVEEQFYLFWPLLLAAGVTLFGRFSRSITALFLCVVLVGSFFVMTRYAVTAPARAFFDTEARVWQLATGALLAVCRGQVERETQGQMLRLTGMRTVIGWCGLMAIVASALAISHDASSSLLRTVAATAGTAAAIYGGDTPRGSVGTALSSRPLLWVGARSYSLYLWHWPVLLFLPLLLPSFDWSAWLAFALVFPIAAAAFALVEEPLRVSALTTRAPRLVVAGALGCCSLGAIATAALPMFDLTVSAERAAVIELLKKAKADGPRYANGDCGRPAEPAEHPCIYGAIGGKKRVVLFGDSHAEHFFDGLNAAAVANGWELRVWIKGSCPPVDAPVYDEQRKTWNTGCDDWRLNAIKRLLDEPPDLVIISSWTGVAARMYDATTSRRHPPEISRQRWTEGFQRVLLQVVRAGIKTIVVRDVPGSAKSFGTTCIEERVPADCQTPRAQALTNRPDVDAAAVVPGIEILDLSDRFCDARYCPAMKADRPVYRADNNHITATVSLMLKSDFEAILKSGP